MRTRAKAGLLAAAGALLGTLLVGLPGSTSADGGHERWGRDDDEVADYGVCRGTDPRCYHEWPTPFRNDGVWKVLVYSRTGVSRHAHLGPLLGPGKNPPLAAGNIAQRRVVEWGQKHGFAVDWTEDVAQLDSPGRLLPYDAVVFLSNSRDILDDAAQTGLMQYVRAGGGFVAIHNTLGAEYHWPWFQGLLGGANFYDHGPNRAGLVRTVNRRDVSTAALPREWRFTDEWYNLIPEPSDVRVLLEMDEASAGNAVGFNGHPGMGRDHPVSWCQYYDGGRSWVTSLGHDVAAWTDAPLEGDAYFEDHVVNGILSAMGAKPFCR
ncbi:ThuA domain-containing protein [Motilibacter deserti]|uniref:ThuA domain-containing protein n=1 Tax=Motilibacter deserti TaxID=2714956 RepID=A0ABX0GZD4_9ACTN|nr:ThuA domain-containing protein [Motilibacter deserti]NHC16177.1 ThuA domain-containing protein [Motilibacter deserti]